MKIDSKANNLIAIMPDRRPVIAVFGHEEDARALVAFVGQVNKAVDAAMKLIAELAGFHDLSEEEREKVRTVKHALHNAQDIDFTWAEELK